MDSVVVISTDLRINTGLFYTFCTCAVVGQLFCLLCFIFNIKYRNTRFDNYDKHFFFQNRKKSYVKITCYSPLTPLVIWFV